MAKNKAQKRMERVMKSKIAEKAKIVRKIKIDPNWSEEQKMAHLMYFQLINEESISDANKEELTKNFIVARAIGGEALEIPKKYMIDVAEQWQEMSDTAITKEEKEGYAANAQYMRTMYSMINENGTFFQIGW